MGKPILVVGGAGYIGSTTAYRLADAGYEVHLLDSLVTGFRELAGAGPLHIVDLADKAALMSIFEANPYEAVLHFAAYIAVGESVREPLKYYENNVAGTLNLLDAMRTHHVKRLVFSSTAAVYGEPQEVPIPETHPLAPINPYGWSKRMMEQVFADCRNAWGLETVALRYFNAAGAEAAGRTGEWHRPETHLVPVALRAALENGTPHAGLRLRLPDPRRHLRPRLHPRQRPRRRPPTGPRTPARRRQPAKSSTLAPKPASPCSKSWPRSRKSPDWPSPTPWPRAAPATRPAWWPAAPKSAANWAGSATSAAPHKSSKTPTPGTPAWASAGGGHVPYVSLPEATSSRLRSKHNPSA